MELKREYTNRINWALDNLLPPLLRDSRLVMAPLFRLLLGAKARNFMEFKDQLAGMTPQGFDECLHDLAEFHIRRKTDLLQGSVDRILRGVTGKRVLDVACGRGYLAEVIHREKGADVVGIDIAPPPVSTTPAGPVFMKGTIESIPFPDGHFDTVVCAHTLEHVRDLAVAASELRRVAGRRLIVVVPRQREYRYTFDLHIHFFPYPFSLRRAMGNHEAILETIGNDFYYQEERPPRG